MISGSFTVTALISFNTFAHSRISSDIPKRSPSSSFTLQRNTTTTHLYDSGFPNMLCSRRAVQHPITVRRSLDVAKPARPVGVAHQVGVESDRIIAGVTYG